MHVAGFNPRAKIFNHPIGLKHIAADLIAPGDAAFLAVKAFHFGALFVQPLRINLGEQQFHRGRFVLMLRPLVLRGRHRSGRDMGNADRGLYFIHVLAAFAAGTVSINS